MLTLTNTDFYKNVGPVSNPTLTLVCPYIILRNVLYVQFLETMTTHRSGKNSKNNNNIFCFLGNDSIL